MDPNEEDSIDIYETLDTLPLSFLFIYVLYNSIMKIYDYLDYMYMKYALSIIFCVICKYNGNES